MPNLTDTTNAVVVSVSTRSAPWLKPTPAYVSRSLTMGAFAPLVGMEVLSAASFRITGIGGKQAPEVARKFSGPIRSAEAANYLVQFI